MFIIKLHVNFGVTSSGKYWQWGCVRIGWLEYLYLRSRGNWRLQKNKTHLINWTMLHYYTQGSTWASNCYHCRKANDENDWLKHVRTNEIEYGYNFVINTDLDFLMCTDWIELFVRTFLKSQHLKIQVCWKHVLHQLVNTINNSKYNHFFHLAINSYHRITILLHAIVRRYNLSKYENLG